LYVSGVLNKGRYSTTLETVDAGLKKILCLIDMQNASSYIDQINKAIEVLVHKPGGILNNANKNQLYHALLNAELPHLYRLMKSSQEQTDIINKFQNTLLEHTGINKKQEEYVNI
jgi:hypothetical protein